MSIGWKFPPNNYGKEDGLNDPGIETFLSRPLESLAREVIQNSRDATQDSSKPVIVQFDVYDVPRVLFPGVTEFDKILSSCGKYWHDNPKAKRFFEHAQTLLSQDSIPFLKISDFNTNGLSGANAPRGKDWHKLTKSVGASDKHEGKDGSFGIGKHAPFACSAFRTVFYGTKAKDDKTVAFQGVAKLVTHLNRDAEETQGTGYFGEKEKLRPIFDLKNVDEFFSRKKFGTDIFIPGFVYESDWAETIAVSVIKNFFVSIHEEQLIVQVDDIRIDSTSLPMLMETLVNSRDSGGTVGFFKSLVDENAHVFSEDNFMGLGRIELNVVIDDKLPKQVAMVRKSGMLVYIKKRFRTPLRFSAVFVARGDALNTFLTSLEPPAHDNWEPQRHVDDVAFARKVLQEMQSWIADKIKDLSSITGSEEIDPEGLGQFLPDELDTDSRDEKDLNSSDGPAKPKEVEMHVRTSVPSAHDVIDSGNGGGDDLFKEDFDSSDIVQDGDSGGDLDETDEGGMDDEEDEGGGPGDQSKSERLVKVNLSKVRFFCTDANVGEYMLSYYPESTGDGILQVRIVGEVGNESAPISSASDMESGVEFNIGKGGIISGVDFIAGERRQIKIRLREKLRCAMEVLAHAS